MNTLILSKSQWVKILEIGSRKILNKRLFESKPKKGILFTKKNSNVKKKMVVKVKNTPKPLPNVSALLLFFSLLPCYCSKELLSHSRDIIPELACTCLQGQLLGAQFVLMSAHTQSYTSQEPFPYTQVCRQAFGSRGSSIVLLGKKSIDSHRER